MLSAQQLALMQQTTAALRTTPCSIQRNTPTSDGMGGQTLTWTEIASVLCQIAPAAKQGRGEVIEDERLEQLSFFVIRLPAGQDATIRDRIVAQGTTYEVQNVESPRTIEIQRMVMATVVTS